MLRSWMFIPGNEDKFLEKSQSLLADAFIFDLEDSVSLANKESARVKVTNCLRKRKGKSNYVRVNDLSTPYFLDDLSKIVGQGLTGIVLPKVNDKNDIVIADYLIGQLEYQHDLEPDSISIVPIIETAKGLYNAYEIALESERIFTLAFGAEDFMLDLTIDPQEDETELVYARSKLVTVAKASGKEAPIDSVYTKLSDEEGFKASVETGKRLGFQGKLLIHPKQIKVTNQIYAPSESEIEKATKIVKAYEASVEKGYASIEVDGQMVDVPVFERAKRLLLFNEPLE